jgi:hypothetical protein
VSPTSRHVGQGLRELLAQELVRLKAAWPGTPLDSDPIDGLP